MADEPQSAFLCPTCRRPLWDRRSLNCGYCGKPVPPEMLLTQSQMNEIDKQLAIKRKRLWVEIALAAAAGSGQVVLMRSFDTYTSVGHYEFIYPPAIGLLLGIFGRGPVWILGPATMLILPVGMLYSLCAGSDGWNLWPIALVFYGCFAFLGFVGAAVGRLARRGWTIWRKDHGT